MGGRDRSCGQERQSTSAPRRVVIPARAGGSARIAEGTSIPHARGSTRERAGSVRGAASIAADPRDRRRGGGAGPPGTPDAVHRRRDGQSRSTAGHRDPRPFLNQGLCRKARRQGNALADPGPGRSCDGRPGETGASSLWLGARRALATRESRARAAAPRSTVTIRAAPPAPPRSRPAAWRTGSASPRDPRRSGATPPRPWRRARAHASRGRRRRRRAGAPPPRRRRPRRRAISRISPVR